MRFGADYREDVALADGTAVRLRCVRPSDKELLLRGFERLSPESRYRRFFTVRKALTAADLRYLTEVDGVRHFAFGALCRDAEGRQHGIGVARFISVDGVVAEPAVAVVDEMQGKGLGRVLFQRLVAAAQERGIVRFQAEVLAINEPMRKLLAEVSQDHGTVTEDGVLALDVPLDVGVMAAGPHRNPLYHLLTLAAQGLVVARHALARALGAEPDDAATDLGAADSMADGAAAANTQADGVALDDHGPGAKGAP